MSKLLILVDAGHGGINPETGKYVTPGKRSPKENGETVLYEGVNNRIISKLVVEALKNEGFDAIDLFPSYEDVELDQRCEIINELCKDRETVLISIHSDGYGTGKEWTPPKGIGSFKYTRCSNNSSMLAKYLQNRVKDNFKHLTTSRGVKSRNFKILRSTKCPAVLMELGFHTNKSEVELMKTDNWKRLAVKTIVEGCIDYAKFKKYKH